MQSSESKREDSIAYRRRIYTGRDAGIRRIHIRLRSQTAQIPALSTPKIYQQNAQVVPTRRCEAQPQNEQSRNENSSNSLKLHIILPRPVNNAFLSPGADQNRKQPGKTVHSIPVVNNATYIAQQMLTHTTPAAPLTYKLPRYKYTTETSMRNNIGEFLHFTVKSEGKEQNAQSVSICVDRCNGMQTDNTIRYHVGNQEDHLMEAVHDSGTDDSGRNEVTFTLGDNSQEESTMSSTLIIPDRTIPCSQRMSFTGDNEPVLNSAPEVDESGDTFLKRMQRSKLKSPNDSCMLSGHAFCFEAVLYKRYNRWKRRLRKKNSERRQPVVVPGSISSDENDERKAVIERIIDIMYEQIHGSSDKQCTRNSRSREKDRATAFDRKRVTVGPPRKICAPGRTLNNTNKRYCGALNTPRGGGQGKRWTGAFSKNSCWKLID
ncbi:hypothetical protein DPMN_193880 [Dreissena polymorpha]|uniref:Uncharacterized protein n=1 Tax=Dreissena polymorpha TaxID=45954 RepID=A0A9D3Y5N6_DREPO|nr:hypothetical protein DPMN_193880 [Dreissena polymorpha]